MQLLQPGKLLGQIILLILAIGIAVSVSPVLWIFGWIVEAYVKSRRRDYGNKRGCFSDSNRHVINNGMLDLSKKT